ncbi:protein kinase [Actinocrispum sp. NPDC049592]|uniref:protein kinase domain-containing protein n=1 Tax=Actinocrispum sp. NPDC049592 TaxID=3154835 RepID=UPI00341E1EAF
MGDPRESAEGSPQPTAAQLRASEVTEPDEPPTAIVPKWPTEAQQATEIVGQPQPPAPVAEMRLPGYSEFTKIAEGGEGIVYRARQDGLDRFVAVKVINVDDPARVARFRRELEITVRLGRQHPHIVTVLATGTVPDGRPCIVMEYYDLGSLHDRLRGYGPLPVADVVAAGMAVADALSFAHGQGFLHRDVKPQNILMLPTSYVLADFGIARMADSGHSTSLHMVSYRHAAPQMVDGQPPDVTDDIYSLGSTMFTLLEGVAPYASDNPEEDTVLSYIGRLRSAEPRPLTRPDVPPELQDVILTCLRKDRADRYPDAAILRAALAAVPTRPQGWVPLLPKDIGEATTRLDDEPPTAITDEPTAVPDFGPRPEHAECPPPIERIEAPTPEPIIEEQQPPKPKSKRGVLYGLIALVIGVAAGVTAVVLSGRSTATPPPPPATTTTTTTPTATTQSGGGGGDPAFAPKIVNFDDRGTSIQIDWTDPAAGKAEFVVVNVTGAKPQALRQIPAGTTSFTVDGLDRASTRYCFQVLAISTDDPAGKRGASDKVCTSR